MRIGRLARQLGTTPHTVRFYERRGVLAPPERTENGYRQYTEADADRLRLLLGLRQLGLSLDQSAELAASCSEGRCDQVSEELRELVGLKRIELRESVRELSYLDLRLAHLEGSLEAGEAPRPLITLREEDSA